MDKVLRFLRIVAFVGLSFVFVYVICFHIKFSYIFSIAFHPGTFKDYFYSFIMGSCIAYPILFILSVVYLKVRFGGVNLLFSTCGSVGLLTLFLQNEVQLPSNVIFKIHFNIFSHNSNWLGASFIGFNNSKGLIKVIRRIIGAIAYVILPVIFHIIFLVIVAIAYYLFLICFNH